MVSALKSSMGKTLYDGNMKFDWAEGNSVNMLKNNFIVVSLYIGVILADGVLLYWIDPSFPYLISAADGIFFIYAGLFVGCGFLLKLQKSTIQDIVSVLFLALLLSTCLAILAFEYDYIASIIHQNTPDLKVFPESVLGGIGIFCLPFDWFLKLPDSAKYIKPYYIIFAGIYPSLMIFIGIQVKRFFVMKKAVKIEE